MNNLTCFLTSLNPATWGTISDWVIAVATSISLYFLIGTLRSQVAAQETQNKLLRIEIARFLKDQNLSLAVNVVSCTPFKLGEALFRVVFDIMIENNNANFKKLIISCRENIILAAGQETEFNEVRIKDKIRYQFSLEMPYQQYLDNKTLIHLRFDVTDHAENKLRKIVELYCQNGSYGITDRDDGFEKVDD